MNIWTMFLIRNGLMWSILETFMRNPNSSSPMINWESQWHWSSSSWNMLYESCHNSWARKVEIFSISPCSTCILLTTSMRWVTPTSLMTAWAASKNISLESFLCDPQYHRFENLCFKLLTSVLELPFLLNPTISNPPHIHVAGPFYS